MKLLFFLDFVVIGLCLNLMIQDQQEVRHPLPKWRPARIGTKQDWQDRFKNIRIGRKGVEETEKVENSTMAAPFYDDNMYILNMKNDLEAKARNFHNVQFIVPFSFCFWNSSTLCK